MKRHRTGGVAKRKPRGGDRSAGRRARERARVVPEGLQLVTAVDPGGTTGVFSGVVDLDGGGTLRQTLKKIDRRQAMEVKGDYMGQAKKLAEFIATERATCNMAGIPIPSMHVVVENFVLRLPAKTTTLDSIWVAAALEGYMARDGIAAEYQEPSQAKTYAKDERLKLWGLWEVGSAHKRDAARHFALRVNKLLG